MFNRWIHKQQRKLPLAKEKNSDAPGTPNVSLFSRIATAASKAVAVTPEEPKQADTTDFPMDDFDDHALGVDANRPISPSYPAQITQDMDTSSPDEFPVPQRGLRTPPRLKERQQCSTTTTQSLISTPVRDFRRCNAFSSEY